MAAVAMRWKLKWNGRLYPMDNPGGYHYVWDSMLFTATYYVAIRLLQGIEQRQVSDFLRIDEQHQFFLYGHDAMGTLVYFFDVNKG